MVTKEEFTDWRANKVTKAVYQAIEVRIQELKDRLVGEVIHSQEEAKATAGAIEAFKYVLEIDYEESNGS